MNLGKLLILVGLVSLVSTLLVINSFNVQATAAAAAAEEEEYQLKTKFGSDKTIIGSRNKNIYEITL